MLLPAGLRPEPGIVPQTREERQEGSGEQRLQSLSSYFQKLWVQFFKELEKTNHN